MSGYEGDTLASALMANGVSLVGRSLRYHRPRGVLSAGPEEPNAIVTLGTGPHHEPNVRATTQPLFDGLVASSQNCWPSPHFDLKAVPGAFSRLLPTGFYYKTFKWPHWHWYEGAIRNMAGLGKAPEHPDPDIYDKMNTHCDLLVIGGGLCGLQAAEEASRTGERVILADEQTELGGCLLGERDGDSSLLGDIARLSASLDGADNVQVLRRTSVIASYDHNFFTAVETRNQRTRQRLWCIRTKEVILATGAIERPLVFPDNDRPGIMLASAVRHYVNRYGVRPGTRAVIFTNSDDAWRTAFDLHDQSIEIAAIVDVRREPDDQLRQEASKRGLRVLNGYAIVGTRGYRRVNAVDVAPINADGQPGGSRGRISCDLLCMSGGWTPSVHLLSQAGGKLEYDPKRQCFVPSELPAGMKTIGAANGDFGRDGKSMQLATMAWWQTPSGKGLAGLKRQWVDLLHDVTTDDINLAAQEGFTSVEHLKRYTSVGMAIDQGKTSNLNALAILGEATGRDLGDVGTTKFRPPWQPTTLGTMAGRIVGDLATRHRHLPLHNWHLANGGVMESHSGWQRPAFYPIDQETEEEAIRREVLAVRNDVGLLDSSSLGKIEVSGPDVATFLNRVYINNVKTLKVGKIRYGMMLNENGIIIDDGVLARLEDNHWLISTSSAGFAGVAMALEEWLQCEWPELDVLVTPVATQWATLAITGPKARDLLATLITDVDLSPDTFKHMSLRTGHLDGLAWRLMRVSFTGELSFELNIPTGHAWDVWHRLLEAGRTFNLTPLGMEALDVLRIEKGFLEVGVETDGSTTPLDVGWATPISKKKADFIGKRSLSRPNDRRSDRLQLVGLLGTSLSRHLPVGSHIINSQTGRSEGHVTSSCLSPTLGQSIAMAMLTSGHGRMEEAVIVDADGERLEAKVVPPNFFDPGGARLKM